MELSSEAVGLGPFFSNTHFKPGLLLLLHKMPFKIPLKFCLRRHRWLNSLLPYYYTFIWSLSFNAFRFLERAKMSHFSFIFSAQYSKKGDFATALTIDDIINVDFSRLFSSSPVFLTFPYITVFESIFRSVTTEIMSLSSFFSNDFPVSIPS